MCEGWSQTALPKMHGAFEVVAVLLGLFIFVYPVVSLLPALTQAGGGPMV